METTEPATSWKPELSHHLGEDVHLEMRGVGSDSVWWMFEFPVISITYAYQNEAGCRCIRSAPSIRTGTYLSSENDTWNYPNVCKGSWNSLFCFFTASRASSFGDATALRLYETRKDGEEEEEETFTCRAIITEWRRNLGPEMRQ